jgi:hypothetical protein
MDDLDELGEVAFVPCMVLGYLVSWAIFGWGLGWHWWWALPAAVPAAPLVGGAIFGVVWTIFDPEDVFEAPPPNAELAERPKSAGSRNGDYQRLKRAMAKRLHPDLYPAASRGERRVREAVFKEFWAEVEDIERNG